MAKLSKREAAAKKAGGKLNYSTGKISVPVKSVKQAASKSSGINSQGGVGDTPYGPTVQAVYSGPTQPGSTVQPGYYNTETKGSTPVGSGSSSSNRSKAAKAVTTSTDYNKATLQPTTSRDYSSLGSKLVQGVTNVAKAVVPGAQTLADLYELSGRDLTSMLGINKALASDSGLEQYTNDQGQVLSVPEQQALYDYNNQPNDGQPVGDANQFVGDALQKSKNQGIFSTQGFAPASSQQVAYNRTPRQTTTQPTQTAFGGGQGTDLSSLIQQVVSHPDFQGLQQDNTPVNNGQSGTQRQFLGNGMLSNGMASNGKLDSGLDGLSMGAPMSEEESLLNQLLGIKSAQAAEMPQTMSSFGMQNTPVSPYAGAMSIPGQATPSWATSPIGNGGEQRQITQNRTPQPTNTAAQFSQGATGGNSSANPMLDYQNKAMKGFSQQEKAQKKALDELIKSIKSQYSTSQTTGINDLNTAKQQDLLKLSGLFSFANQDPNSEQRVQYEQRANQDYAKQQGDFIAKLAAAQQQDISGANQGYQSKLADIMSQRNNAQYNIAQLLQKAQDDARSSGTSGTNKNQTAIQALLNRAANMPSGGREYAQQQATAMGLGNISSYTPNGWENAYNPNFGQTTPTKFQSIGNGYVMDPSTGDVFQAYDPNAY